MISVFAKHRMCTIVNSHWITFVIGKCATFVFSNVTTMNRRLQYLLELEGLTQAQFADRIGVGRASISHILSGRNNPGYDIICRIMKKFPFINPDWLILGQGKPYRDKDTDSPTLFNGNESIDTEPIIRDTGALFPLENRTEPQLSTSAQRKIKRITIYYDDNTFEEFAK